MFFFGLLFFGVIVLVLFLLVLPFVAVSFAISQNEPESAGKEAPKSALYLVIMIGAIFLGFPLAYLFLSALGSLH